MRLILLAVCNWFSAPAGAGPLRLVAPLVIRG